MPLPCLIIFDYMCTHSKNAIMGIKTGKSSHPVSIFDLFENSYVNVRGMSMSMADVITLKMAPFPMGASTRDNEVDQVLYFLKYWC